MVKGRPLYDNGEGNDLIAGDNIYSSIDPITFPESNYAGRQSTIEWYIKCSIDASLKGGQCNGGTCPDKTYWGNDTWFCV